MPNSYYFFDAKGYRIVVFDPNYLFLDGKYIPYSESNYYAHPEARDYIPPEQLAWLRETLATSPFPCVTPDSVTDKIYTSRGRTCEPIIQSADITLH